MRPAPSYQHQHQHHHINTNTSTTISTLAPSYQCQHQHHHTNTAPPMSRSTITPSSLYLVSLHQHHYTIIITPAPSHCSSSHLIPLFYIRSCATTASLYAIFILSPTRITEIRQILPRQRSTLCACASKCFSLSSLASPNQQPTISFGGGKLHAVSCCVLNVLFLFHEFQFS